MGLLYISHQDGQWQAETVENKVYNLCSWNLIVPMGKYIGPPSIVVDQQGHAHMSYVVLKGDAINMEGVFTEKAAHIHYATNRSGQWESQVVDRYLSGFDSALQSDAQRLAPIIALDADAKAHLFYSAPSKSYQGNQRHWVSLIHATYSGTFWKKALIDGFNQRDDNDNQGGAIYLDNVVIQDNIIHVIYKKRFYTAYPGSIELVHASKPLHEKTWSRAILSQTQALAATEEGKAFAWGAGSTGAQLLLLDKQHSIHIFSTSNIWQASGDNPAKQYYTTSITHGYMQ